MKTRKLTILVLALGLNYNNNSAAPSNPLDEIKQNPIRSIQSIFSKNVKRAIKNIQTTILSQKVQNLLEQALENCSQETIQQMSEKLERLKQEMPMRKAIFTKQIESKLLEASGQVRATTPAQAAFYKKSLLASIDNLLKAPAPSEKTPMPNLFNIKITGLNLNDLSRQTPPTKRQVQETKETISKLACQIFDCVNQIAVSEKAQDLIKQILQTNSLKELEQLLDKITKLDKKITVENPESLKQINYNIPTTLTQEQKQTFSSLLDTLNQTWVI